MKKKLVTALVLASLFSGVSAVYADYTDEQIDTKVNDLKQADVAINGKIDDINGKYNKLAQAQGELEKTLSTNIEGVRNALGLEITNRETKDKELDEKIATEATARETKDKELEEKIIDEKTAREAKEAELSGKITDEKDDRVAKDIELGNDLKAEKTAREEKDKKLDEKITGETAAREEEDKKIREDFAAADKVEKDARIAEDKKIRGEFAEADKKLDGKITGETAAREALEKKFNGRFDQETEVLDRETKERKGEDAKIRSEFAAGDQVLGQRIDKLAADTDKGLAKVSALAGLHPLDYDPSNKLNLAVAGGFYNGENAVALGAFYRPNRNIMLSLGASLAGGDNAYNVGVSVKVGKGGDRMDESSTTVSELYALVGRMQEEMMAQRNQIAEQQRKIEELEAR